MRTSRWTRIGYGVLVAAVVVWLLRLLAPPVTAFFEVRKGLRALDEEKYEEAALAFNRALTLRPGLLAARQHLAVAYRRQYVAGGDTVENLELGRAARQQLTIVVQEEPSNEEAIALLASLCDEQDRFDDAQALYERLVAVRPSADAYLRLGAIAWKRFLPVHASARAALGMKQDEPGPIGDEPTRVALRTEWLAVLDKAMANLSTAISLDRELHEAMLTMSMVVRGRADLAGSAREYEEGIRAAETWLENARTARAAVTQKQQAEQKP